MVDERFAPLFEPIAIGPVTAKNRFYQVPHCNGAGDRAPRAVARMREMKAEGGWAVVCTENLMIDPWSDISPFPAMRLWDDDDIPAQEVMVEAVHRHGALAGCELTHFGMAAANRWSRLESLGPDCRMTIEATDPVQSRAMDLADIRSLRHRHRAAALRAKRAGFDIVYVYVSHENSVFSQFLSPLLNTRSDAYGGSAENRMRLLREVIEDTKDAIGDRCAVAVRIAVAQFGHEEPIVSAENCRETIERLADLPDLWDVNINDWSHDSATSRFAREGHQEDQVRFVKSVTHKPVVGVGRFSSPDSMLSQVRRGVLDLVGCARQSIADPFLPRKIEEGRFDEIRECVGCNICVSGESSFSTMRCTQNPTIMEEWRRDWHPEIVSPRGSDDGILVVGAGPAGLECALTLGRRGYHVTLAEAGDRLGGRVTAESPLPGLAEWIRVRDYRVQQLQLMPNVEVFLESRLDADQVREFGFPRVAVATGARWRRDGLGRSHLRPMVAHETPAVYTPEDVMSNKALSGPVVIYDDDGSYLAPALAEALRARGLEVTIVTPHLTFARWTRLTLEQHRLYRRMADLGVSIESSQRLKSVAAGTVTLENSLDGRTAERAFGSLVMVTSRIPDDALHRDLVSDEKAMADSGIKSVERIGDCRTPGLIAMAVFSGHQYARSLDTVPMDDVPYRREVVRAH